MGGDNSFWASCKLTRLLTVSKTEKKISRQFFFQVPSFRSGDTVIKKQFPNIYIVYVTSLEKNISKEENAQNL